MSDPASERLPGAAERAAPGPVHHKGPGPRPSGWLDPRGRAAEGRAFALHRITGLLIVVYLYVHLCVLSMLLVGNSSWHRFLSLVTAKGFLAFDILLILMLLFHGLNGIRVAVVGSGIGVRYEHSMFWVGIAVGCCAIVFTALHVYGAL
ncbi:MAG: hypothetical protein ACLP0J_12340 [Solirubrobacteraceae bacterium]|jgi:succinate dehydrogenase / fumarate reductase cytochrome b subunit